MPALMNEAWWKGVKKKHGAKFPTTGLTPALKKYEAAYDTLDNEPSIPNHKKVVAALQLVKEALAATIEKCDEEEDEEKWEALRGVLMNVTLVKKDEVALKKSHHALVLAWKREKAMNEDEAEYETAWDDFEELKDARAKEPSLELFDEIADQCKVLERLAEQCKETPALIKKYNIQLKIIEKERRETLKIAGDYQDALDDCVKLRKKILVDMEEAHDSLKDIYGQMEKLIEKMATAAEEKDFVTCSTLLNDIEETGKLSKEVFQQGSDPFAPGTTARNSLDIRAAKIHKEDTVKYITEHFTALINQNKANSNLNKQVQEMVQIGKDLMPKRSRR